MLALSVALCVSAPPPPQTDTKAVLLLDDLSVVEAVPHAGGFAVRRGKTLEPVPAERVRFAGDSRAAVHRYLLSQSATPTAAPAAVGFAPGSLPLFAGKVQAVLLNRCGRCHAAPDHPGRFKLARIPAGFADPEATERNARAAALHLDRQNPLASPLLQFAVVPHGPAKTAPLDRSHPAFGPLEQWAKLAAGPKPPAAVGQVSNLPVPTTPGPGPGKSPGRVGQVGNLPHGADPTDPGPFNRAVHPGRAPSPTR